MFVDLEERIRKEEKISSFINNVVMLEKIDSTNSYAKELKDQVDGTLIVAKEQTQGRGRNNRTWKSFGEKNLTFSLIVNYPEDKEALGLFSLLSANSVAATIEELGLIPEIKWPNDILVEGHKLAGILIENVMSSGGKIKSFIGIGLNVNQSDFKEFNRPATSLALLCKHHFDLPTLAVQLQEAILRRYDQANWNLILEEYNATLYGQGAHQVFEDAAGNPKKTESIKVNSDGQMILKLMGGKEEVYDHGQLTYLI